MLFIQMAGGSSNVIEKRMTTEMGTGMRMCLCVCHENSWSIRSGTEGHYAAPAAAAYSSRSAAFLLSPFVMTTPSRAFNSGQEAISRPR